jgi:SAM-dependent methyltransferase
MPCDTFYLHLSDLHLALSGHASGEPIKILDFGAGGSPYSVLFPNSQYSRADIAPGTGMDFLVYPDGTTNAPSATFDLVISTQVLEHCVDPNLYLSECERVLRPGGKLLLTTHGTYQDHGCPYDFHRWTADGLRVQITTAGFVSEELTKLTTNARALAFLMLEHSGFWCGARPFVARFLLKVIYKIIQSLRAPFQYMVDSFYPNCRMVPANNDGAVLYIALLAVAEKPSATQCKEVAS